MRRARFVAGMALAALALFAVPAQAATFTVNTTTDLASDGVCNQGVAGGCTLRDALAVATSSDSVTLPAGTYNLNPQFGPLSLIGDKLNGVGARTTVIDGGLAIRVMSTSNDSGPSVPVAPQVAGVTIRRGNGVTPVPMGSSGTGGGIFVSGALTLVNSQVVSNAASSDGGGIGLASGADLTMIGSTVAGNTATGGRGGGIFSANEGLLALANSTVSGNTAVAAGGGIWGGGGTVVGLFNATIAGNQATTGGGVFSSSQVFRNSILAGNSPTSCATTGTTTSNNNLVQDGSCGLTGTGDIQGVDPGLGALANNGGPTDTRAIGPASFALNRGGAECQATDQRGVARPQGGACDIGAYEYRAPLLTVIKRVVNDDKGIEAADDFAVHVRVGAADVAGSPAPGSASGRTYTLTPGSYSVGEDASEVYAGSFAGDCSATGVVVLAEGQSKTCTVTNDDKAPGARVFNVEPKRGTVRIKLPGRKRFRRLTEGEQLPVGTTVDTLKGRVTIIAASNKTGGTSRADFYDGIFKLGQTRGKLPITTLTLVERLTGCKAAGKQANAAAKKKRKRRLWGDGKGRFRTRGSHSAATVVGTKWLVEDRCASTLTRVVRGRVKVTDFEKDKSVFVRKGHRYIARAQ
jgi:hypothetical protein